MFQSDPGSASESSEANGGGESHDRGVMKTLKSKGTGLFDLVNFQKLREQRRIRSKLE